ncbi:MAG: T9SS type A sorting domain-containing protein, partial [Flavobacteriaceae bacterium]
EEAYVMLGGSSLEAQYIIFDIQGNILLDRKVQLELENRKIPIDMSSLAGGNYFIKIKTSQNEETIKFIRR